MSDYKKISVRLDYLNYQIKKISESDEFIDYYKIFKNNKNFDNYSNLKKFLRNIYNEKLEIYFKKSKSSLIFIDDRGVVIWNSDLDDTYGNTFENYLNGKISIQNIYQFQCSSQAQQTRKARVLKSIKDQNGKFSNYAFVSRIVGSTLTSGFSSSNKKCYFCF